MNRTDAPNTSGALAKRAVHNPKSKTENATDKARACMVRFEAEGDRATVRRATKSAMALIGSLLTFTGLQCNPATITLSCALPTALLAGCSQNTAAPVAQGSGQSQPTDQSQQAQAGAYDVRIYVQNAPGDNAASDALDSGGPAAALLGEGKRGARVADANSNAGENRVRDTEAGYVLSGTTINLTVGGSSTTPTATQTTGGQTNQPGATVTQTPNQEPKVSTTVPIAVGMPGSAPQASGAGTVEGPANTTATLDAQLSTLLQKAAKGDPAAIEALRTWLASKAPASQPGGQ